MTEKAKKTVKTKNALFSKNMKIKLSEWRKTNKKTKEDFVSEVCAYENEQNPSKMSRFSSRSLDKYLSGEQYPSAHMEAICYVLETSEEELSIGTYEEQYQYSEHFTKHLHQESKSFCEGIGLDLNFLKFIHNTVPDEDFPIYSPLLPVVGKNTIKIDGDHITEKGQPLRYKRQDDFLTAFTSEEDNEFQRHLSNGQTVNLHYADLAFIKDVQEEVTKYALYLMYKRKQEMEQELQNLNTASRPSEGIRIGLFSAEKIASFDRYSKYCTKETIDQIIKKKQ